MMWIHVLLLTLVVLLLPDAATAKVYRCEGANGGTILTDQPKGKNRCVVVETASPSPPGGFTPPVELPRPAQPELPSPAIPPPAPGSALLPRQPGSSEHPPSPTASREAAEKAAPEAQRCSPRVNPLNPFAGMNCSPASGNLPDETKKP